ncbi:antitoxin VbhA family protein [Phocaeicola plebeius]|uniref:antitoxin VbhA family protein n=1 Tax=Phocaeicola plebeius TaxID=310297 RepID=UPI00266BB4D3|nr:antitoxin VbhA family protein [Phocaeicola plebeius]
MGEIEMTEEEKEKRIEAMKYAIHSNELEGNITSDEDKEIFFKVATGELTIEEAKKIFRL